MRAAFLGPEFSNEEVRLFLDRFGAKYRLLDHNEVAETTARLLAEEKVIGWFQGRMEFGPRALGARSILGDPRSTRMQSIMNLKIKFRESFRPFAPVVLRECVQDYFEMDVDSPYMLLVAPVREHLRIPMTEEQQKLFGIEKLNIPRSTIPAITHVDYSARVQTIRREDHPIYYDLIAAFNRLTGCPVLVNTSFNVRGEPIVCTPEDAYRCFMRTEMDYLVMGDVLLEKAAQSEPRLAQLPDFFDLLSRNYLSQGLYDEGLKASETASRLAAEAGRSQQAAKLQQRAEECRRRGAAGKS
jgi:carbamoyltransferase